jgi:hypothetical protein
MGASCSSSRGDNKPAPNTDKNSEGGAAGYQQKSSAAAPKKKGATAAQHSQAVSNLGTEIALDPVTKQDLAALDALENLLKAKLADKTQVNSMWKTLDFNGNGIVSLAEIDKWIVDPSNGFQILNHKPALMRAYKLTISMEGESQRNTDFVHKKEFPALVRNVFYYNKVYQIFEEMANSPTERRIDFPHFKSAAAKMGLVKDDAEAEREFKEIAGVNGREILFDQFCAWVAEEQIAGLDLDDD